MKSSKKDFIAEAGELLEEAERLLLELQDTVASGVNPDTINGLFRTIHTVKGISGLFGFKDVADFSHAFESLLDDLRLGKIEVSPDVMRFLFSNIDTLKKVIGDIGEDRSFDLSGNLRSIESFRDSAREGGGASKPQDLLAGIDESIRKVLSEYEEHRLKTNIKEGKGIYLAKAVFPLASFDTSLNDLITTIKAYGEQISTLPTAADLPPDAIGFNIMFGSKKSLAELSGAITVGIDELVTCKAETSPPPPLPPKAAEAVAAEASLKSTSTFVRVDIEKLDRILNTIGELNLARSATDRISQEMMDIYGHSPLVSDIFKISQTFERRIADLKEQVLEIRMIPMGQVFSRLSQVIRRYSRDSGKQIDLLLYGEDTELDKSLAEEIVDPLMHVVRNAIDHGIETAEERRRTGKKEGGTISLKAYQRGNHVVVEVKDDGGGINVQRLREKAIEKGLLEPGAELAERDIIDFIFMPGFSTKASVSEISGRGVGMDVVKRKISDIGGFVDVETRLGEGTTFILTMPITLAILKALVVRVGQEQFAIPLTSMSENIVVEHRDIQTIEGKEVYNLRGELLPILSIARFFELDRDGAERSFGVVVGYGERRVGLLVDELVGQHEIVIKSLGDYFTSLRGFAGAAEIGRHEVILVVDVESIIEDALFRKRALHHV